jgi:hypothetical protein
VTPSRTRAPARLVLVAAGLAIAGFPTPAAAKVKAKEAWIVKTSANTCEHDASTSGYTLRKAKDSSAWDMSNQGEDNGSRPCPKDQYAILCSYRFDDGTKKYVLDKEVFEKCAVTPAGIADNGMNTAFTLKTGKRVWFNCQAHKDKIKARVLFDSGDAQPTCANTIPVKRSRKKGRDGDDSRYHVIDIEIVP